LGRRVGLPFSGGSSFHSLSLRDEAADEPGDWIAPATGRDGSSKAAIASDGCPIGARISGRPPSSGKRRDSNRLRSAGRQHRRGPQGLSHILHGGNSRRAWRQCSGRLKAQPGSQAPSPGRPARYVEVQKTTLLRAPGRELYFSYGTPLDRNSCRFDILKIDMIGGCDNLYLNFFFGGRARNETARRRKPKTKAVCRNPSPLELRTPRRTVSRMGQARCGRKLGRHP